MKQPSLILAEGTEVQTHTDLVFPDFMVHPTNIANRTPGAKGKIAGVVGGHGGDVYWVDHGDDKSAAYGWWEFELT